MRLELSRMFYVGVGRKFYRLLDISALDDNGSIRDILLARDSFV